MIGLQRQIGRRFMIVPLDDYKLASEADTMIAELRELDADDK